MSHNMGYVILIIVLIGLLILFLFAPTLHGLIINSDNNFIINSGYNAQYYDCIKQCEEIANTKYSAEYYGTSPWNKVYNDCWNANCKKLSN